MLLSILMEHLTIFCLFNVLHASLWGQTHLPIFHALQWAESYICSNSEQENLVRTSRSLDTVQHGLEDRAYVVLRATHLVIKRNKK